VKFGMMTLNKEVLSKFPFGATFSNASRRPNGNYRAFQSAVVGQGQSFYPFVHVFLGARQPLAPYDAATEISTRLRDH
jgi:hypothetical protein